MKNNQGERMSSVTYTRSYSADRSLPISLVGNSRWLKDIELLLEDEWSSVSIALDRNELAEVVKKNEVNIYIVEHTPYGESELRLIESIIPKSVVRLVIEPEGRSVLDVRRMQRDLVSHGVGSIILPADPIQAAAQLAETLKDLVGLISSHGTVDVDKIRAAFHGYQAATSVVSHISKAIDIKSLDAVYKFLLSKFALSFDQLQAACILAETFPLYSKIKDNKDSELFDLYSRVERLLAETAALKLLDLAYTFVRDDATYEQWEERVNATGLGIQAKRKIIREYEKMHMLLKQKENRVKAA